MFIVRTLCKNVIILRKFYTKNICIRKKYNTWLNRRDFFVDFYVLINLGQWIAIVYKNKCVKKWVKPYQGTCNSQYDFVVIFTLTWL